MAKFLCVRAADGKQNRIRWRMGRIMSADGKDFGVFALAFYFYSRFSQGNLLKGFQYMGCKNILDNT